MPGLCDLMTSELCTFCGIFSDESHGEIVAETDNYIALVPSSMSLRGHLLLIPKEHYETIFDALDEILASILIFARKLSLGLQNQAGVSGVNLLHASG